MASCLPQSKSEHPQHFSFHSTPPQQENICTVLLLRLCQSGNRWTETKRGNTHQVTRSKQPTGHFQSDALYAAGSRPVQGEGTSSACPEHPHSIQALVNTTALPRLQESTQPSLWNCRGRSQRVLQRVGCWWVLQWDAFLKTF